MITVFMTAFYMFRAVLTFTGEYRGGAPSEHSSHDSSSHKPHESGKVMIIPLVILSILSISSGWLNVSGGFGEFMGHGGESAGFSEGFFGVLSHPLPLTSLVVALCGIFLAYAMYGAKWIKPETVGKIFKPFYILFSRKFFMDDLYENVFVRKFLYGGIFRAFSWFDSRVVDGTVNGIANGTNKTGKSLSRMQTGQMQLYALSIIIGIIAIFVCIYVFGRGI